LFWFALLPRAPACGVRKFVKGFTRRREWSVPACPRVAAMVAPDARRRAVRVPLQGRLRRSRASAAKPPASVRVCAAPSRSADVCSPRAGLCKRATHLRSLASAGSGRVRAGVGISALRRSPSAGRRYRCSQLPRVNRAGGLERFLRRPLPVAVPVTTVMPSRAQRGPAPVERIATSRAPSTGSVYEAHRPEERGRASPHSLARGLAGQNPGVVLPANRDTRVQRARAS
jgi:hypothetical protein